MWNIYLCTFDGCSFKDLPQIFQNNVCISPDPQYFITNNTDHEIQLIQNSFIDLNENYENATTSVNPSFDTNENISNILAQCPELFRKMIDLTYIIDKKQYPKWSKELDTFYNVHNKMSEMFIKKSG